MLKEYLSKAELQWVAEELRESNRRLEAISSSIDIYLADFLEATLYLYSYTIEAQAKYWFCVRNYLQRTDIYIGVDGEFFADEFHLAFGKVLCECHGLKDLPNDATGCLIADGEALEEAQAMLEACRVECTEATEFLICLPGREYDFRPEWLNEVPQGFTQGPLRDEDAEFVANCWPFSGENEVEMLRKRFEKLPSAALFDVATNSPASFCFLEHNGMIAHLYTKPEFRGRKFRELVFADLLDQCSSQVGILPWYAVTDDNETMLKWTPEMDKPRDAQGVHAKLSILFTKIGRFELPDDILEGMQDFNEL